MIAIIIALAIVLVLALVVLHLRSAELQDAMAVLDPWKMRALNDESCIGFLSKAWARERDRVKELETLVYERDAAIVLLNGRLECTDSDVGSTARPPTPYKPPHRRPWPRPGLMPIGEGMIDTGGDIVDHSEYPRTAADDKFALARLGMDCATFHPADCDCRTTYLQFRSLAQEQA